jgi:hypothetical protein
VREIGRQEAAAPDDLDTQAEWIDRISLELAGDARRDGID